LLIDIVLAEEEAELLLVLVVVVEDFPFVAEEPCCNLPVVVVVGDSNAAAVAVAGHRVLAVEHGIHQVLLEEQVEAGHVPMLQGGEVAVAEGPRNQQEEEPVDDLAVPEVGVPFPRQAVASEPSQKMSVVGRLLKLLQAEAVASLQPVLAEAGFGREEDRKTGLLPMADQHEVAGLAEEEVVLPGVGPVLGHLVALEAAEQIHQVPAGQGHLAVQEAVVRIHQMELVYRVQVVLEELLYLVELVHRVRVVPEEEADRVPVPEEPPKHQDCSRNP